LRCFWRHYLLFSCFIFLDYKESQLQSCVEALALLTSRGTAISEGRMRNPPPQGSERTIC
jgi:hypothetical protein